MVSQPEPVASIYATRFGPSTEKDEDGRPLGDTLIFVRNGQLGGKSTRTKTEMHKGWELEHTCFPVKGALAVKKMVCCRIHSM